MDTTEITIVIRDGLRRTRDAIVHPRKKHQRTKRRGGLARHGRMLMGFFKSVGKAVRFIVGTLAFLLEQGKS